jgi:hypothetical protein
MSEIIRTPDDFVRVLCNRVAEHFRNPPRLRVSRSSEESGARMLCEAGYKAKHLLAILNWVRTNAEWEGWRERITSVASLAQALLTPKDFSNCLESQYEAWVAANPPRCKHGTLLSMICLRCLANPECKICKGTGSIVGEIFIERLRGKYRQQFLCECCGKGSVEEQMAEAERRENGGKTEG